MPTKYFTVDGAIFKQSPYFQQIKANYEGRGFVVEEFTEEEALEKFGAKTLETVRYEFCARIPLAGENALA